MQKISALLLSLISIATFVSPPTFASESAAPVTAAPTCAPDGRITPICHVQAPEDLELLPNAKQILMSQMQGGADHRTGGGLAVLNLADNAVTPLAIDSGFQDGWGEASCKTPPEKIGPHGIHLSQREDDRWQLLVVNHSGREAIEILELVPQKDSYRAIWRGCVVNSTGGLHNDVAASADGGFIATVMLTKEMRARPDALTLMLSGKDTGYLVAWNADDGMLKLPNSDAPFNNGIQISKDGKFAFFNAWTGKQVRKYDLRAQRVVKTIDLPFHPDNLTFRADGMLIDAGINELDSWKACVAAHSDFCQTAFTVVAIDPKTGNFMPVFQGDAGYIAGASVALQVDKKLFIGTYAGDRLLEISR